MNESPALASRLQELNDEDLAGLLSTRLSDLRAVNDFFDLADRILEPAWIEATLAGLPRMTLARLASGQPISPDDDALSKLAALLLLTEKGGSLRPFSAVSAMLAGWPARGLPTAAELADPSEPASRPRDLAEADTDLVAAERAYAATAGVAELLHELRLFPARELAKGGVAAPDAKRLVLALGIDVTGIDPLLRLARIAGLVGLSGMLWSATETALPWLLLPATKRWSLLATAWFDSLSPDIGAVLSQRAAESWGDDAVHHLAWLYPGGGPLLASRVREALVGAEFLGISANGYPGAAARALLKPAAEPIEEVAESLLPAEDPHIYLQHDLSIIAPGPLTPHVDVRLRRLADIEARGLASTYRISGASVTRALADGETAASILEFFSEVSLTGVPQPVEYLVTEASARFGLLRAGQTSPDSEPGTRSYVRGEDPSMLSTLAVDHSLSSLGLQRTGPNRLTSRLAFDTLFWMITDARYPIMAENQEGEPFAPVRAQPVAKETVPVADPVRTLVTKLRESGSDAMNSPEAWIARQLEVAVRAKTPVTVSVAMPDGRTAVYLVTPLSMASGRLRAIDERAGVERTLPVRSITEVGPPS